MQKPTNNKKLTQFLKLKQYELMQITQKEQLEQILEDCVNFPFAIQFNSKPYWILIILCILFALFSFTFLKDADFFIILCLIISIITLMFRQAKISLLKKFNQQIKSVALNIIYHGSPLNQQECQQINQVFYDFNRCNYQNNISDGREIDFHYQQQIMRVKVVTYHGVERIKKVERNSKNEEEIKYEYQHMYRQGVIFPLQFYSNILVSTKPLKTRYKKTFDVTSNQFRHKFYVRGENQLEIAKFLEPDIIENLLIASNELSQLTIEFAYNGNMLISQKENDLLNLNTQFNISHPKEFKDELFQTSSKKLDYLLGFASHLITQMK